MEPDTDAGLLARDYASLTPLVGVPRGRAEASTTPSGRALDALYALPGVGPGPAPDEAPEDERAAGRTEAKAQVTSLRRGRGRPTGPSPRRPARARMLAKACTSAKVWATRTIGWWSPCGSSGGCRPGPDRPAPVDHRDRLVGDRRVRAPVTSCSHPTRDPP